jgi:hypothetical protein
MSVRIEGGTAHLADEVNEFAASIEPAVARWAYAAGAGSYKYHSERQGRTLDVVNDKALPSLSRLLGKSKSRVRSRLAQIYHLGFDEAIDFGLRFDSKRLTDILPLYHSVGPLPHWCCGHVYFARIENYPHVLKVGFSRRVGERLDDIASKHKVKLIVPPRHLKVGTQADEHRWHKDWAQYQIEGEWFFDPRSTDRSLPPFLHMAEAA